MASSWAPCRGVRLCGPIAVDRLGSTWFWRKVRNSVKFAHEHCFRDCRTKVAHYMYFEGCVGCWRQKCLCVTMMIKKLFVAGGYYYVQCIIVGAVRVDDMLNTRFNLMLDRGSGGFCNQRTLRKVDGQTSDVNLAEAGRKRRYWSFKWRAQTLCDSFPTQSYYWGDPRHWNMVTQC